jgi:hypothetical protein
MAENEELKTTGNKLVDSILKILKLDDAGKILKFINKTIKEVEVEVGSYERKNINLKNNYDGALDVLEGNLEDLEEAFVDSFTAIKLEDIITNEAATKFRPTYKTGIKNAGAAVKAKKKEIDELKESLNEATQKNKDQISMREELIKAMKGLGKQYA